MTKQSLLALILTVCLLLTGCDVVETSTSNTVTTQSETILTTLTKLEPVSEPTQKTKQVATQNPTVKKVELSNIPTYSGKGIQFNVFCYNVQPDIEINYINGMSNLKENSKNQAKTKSTPKTHPKIESKQSNSKTYILNTNTKKFHKQGCSSVSKIKDKNKKESSDSRIFAL